MQRFVTAGTTKAPASPRPATTSDQLPGQNPGDDTDSYASALRSGITRPKTTQSGSKRTQNSRAGHLIKKQSQSAGRPAVAQAAAGPAAVAEPAAVALKAVDPGGPWLIVGLGNPGSGYDNTRHNVGFAVIDALAKREGIDCRKLEKSAAVGRGEVCGQVCILAKPVTFMNNSGRVLRLWLSSTRCPCVTF
ncbi:MAG: hypothetical protein WDW38_006794 [Sanguina aurantia]